MGWIREFTEGHVLDRKWRVPKGMIGRRLSQEEAKRLLAQVRVSVFLPRSLQFKAICLSSSRWELQ